MFLNAKTVQQVAALPFVPFPDGIEVLLVTSRHGGRWLLPKGWPEGREPFASAAAREACEEAGVVGTVHHQAIGQYTGLARLFRTLSRSGAAALHQAMAAMAPADIADRQSETTPVG